MMNYQCKDCGYRINPDTALRAGLVSKASYNSNFMIDPLKSWCEKKSTWIRDDDSCQNWISYMQYEGENNY